MRLGLGTLRAHAPRVDARVGIVHLGLGAFHRAHQAVYTEDALAAEPGAWGICGVTRRRPVADALRSQDGLYSVLERGPEADTARVIGVLREVIVAGEEDERLRSRFASPEVLVVTLTVSEAGYHHDGGTGRLDTAQADVAADLAGGPPRTPVGQLVRGLEARRAAGVDAPLAIVCCDNLPRNGDLLRGLVADFCAAAAPGDSGGAERRPTALGADRRRAPVADWIDDHVDFPSTVVDRIVPAATPADRAAASALIGADDEATVVGEPFSQWVIEDAFRGARPAWEQAGALLVPDARPYEAMKLRLVNGGHSLLAYLGLLAGLDTVAAATADERLGGFLSTVLETELAPTLDDVPGIDVNGYRAELLERFANPRMAHRLEQIAAGGARKLPMRLLAPARELLAAGREPAGICLAVAAWLRWLPSLSEPDALHAEVARAVAGASGSSDAATQALAVREVFGDELPESETFRSLLADALEALEADGPLDACARVVSR